VNSLKIVYSDPKSGRSAQIELDKDQSALILNYKIGDMIDGNLIGMPGYKLKITGGSDSSGFPLDRSIQGTIKTKAKRSISKSGRMKGIIKRKTVRGNMISLDVEMINTIIVEYGSKNVTELMPQSEKEKQREAKIAEKKGKKGKQEAEPAAVEATAAAGEQT
jgi:small subunit ribosomal protein S6e